MLLGAPDRALRSLSPRSLLLNHLLESWDSSSKKVGVHCGKEELRGVGRERTCAAAGGPCTSCVPVGPVCAHPALLQHAGGSAGSAGGGMWLPGLRASALSWEQATRCRGQGVYLLADGEGSPFPSTCCIGTQIFQITAPIGLCCSGAVMSGEVTLAVARCPQRSSTAPATLERRLAGLVSVQEPWRCPHSLIRPASPRCFCPSCLLSLCSLPQPLQCRVAWAHGAAGSGCLTP